MIPVSNLDAAMLYAETPEMPMHTLGVLILERMDGAGDQTPFEITRKLFAERIHLIPPFRRRIVQGPLKIGDPHWIEDPDFDLDHHLIRVVLPFPGDMRSLRELVGAFAAHPLDRSRPLWKAALVEGLEHDRISLVMKIHHAAMDGGRAAAIAGELLDDTPEGRSMPRPDEPWVPDREPSVPWLAADTVRTLLGKPKRVLAATGRVATAVRARAGSKRKSSERPSRAPKPPLFEAPPTPFNRALTPNRSVGLSDVSFDAVKRIKEAFGTTVNDVVLSASCGSLRSWLAAHGGLPDRPLVTTVPVSVRHEGDEAANRVSVIRVHLPMQIDDPVGRLRAIHQETNRAKHPRHRSDGGDVLRDFADIAINLTVPWFLMQLMGLYSSHHVADRIPPLWNLVISNIAGPPVPLYTIGARLTHLFPLGPVQEGSGLNITVMSAVDRLCFGALACTELVPDVQDIATGFADEIKRLEDSIDR